MEEEGKVSGCLEKCDIASSWWTLQYVLDQTSHWGHSFSFSFSFHFSHIYPSLSSSRPPHISLYFTDFLSISRTLPALPYLRPSHPLLTHLSHSTHAGTARCAAETVSSH